MSNFSQKRWHQPAETISKCCGIPALTSLSFSLTRQAWRLNLPNEEGSKRLQKHMPVRSSPEDTFTGLLLSVLLPCTLCPREIGQVENGTALISIRNSRSSRIKSGAG